VPINAVFTSIIDICHLLHKISFCAVVYHTDAISQLWSS